jgi:hypothetical protein
LAKVEKKIGKNVTMKLDKIGTNCTKRQLTRFTSQNRQSTPPLAVEEPAGDYSKTNLGPLRETYLDGSPVEIWCPAQFPFLCSPRSQAYNNRK